MSDTGAGGDPKAGVGVFCDAPNLVGWQTVRGRKCGDDSLAQRVKTVAFRTDPVGAFVIHQLTFDWPEGGAIEGRGSDQLRLPRLPQASFRAEPDDVLRVF